MRSVIALCLALAASSAFAQQPPDPAKLAQVYRQQREQAADGIAACSIIASDLQAKIAELEKRLAAKAIDPASTEK